MSLDDDLESDDLWLIGHLVDDRYHVFDLLGEGGMALVFLAHDRVDDRDVALKVMRSDMAERGDLRARFRNEAQATMSIVDPHVVEIMDLGELEDGSSYYVMELLEGLTLGEYADGRPLDPEEVVSMGMQISQALQAAHDKGVIHRDLKPENIIVERRAGEPHIKVLDFGVAKVPTATSLTVPGSVFGTPCYMSPEQAVPRRPVDHRTDVYALGVIMYELLVGEVPFICDDPMQVMLSHVGQPPPPLSKRRPEVPAALASAVHRCLEKKPEDRFPSMRAFCKALETIADDDAPAIDFVEAIEPEVDRTILFDPSTMAISIDELVGNLEVAPNQSQPYLAQPYLAQPYLAGPDQKGLDEQQGGLPPDDVVSQSAETLPLPAVLDTDRLPTPPGPQPWHPPASRAWMVWLAVLLVAGITFVLVAAT